MLSTFVWLDLGWLLKHLPGEILLLELLLLGPGLDPGLLHLQSVLGPQEQQGHQDDGEEVQLATIYCECSQQGQRPEYQNKCK